jgi:DNA polymerase III epsilon subunit-like protein
MKSDLVVVDLETSGVNPFVNDVLAVGLVPVDLSARPLIIYVKATEVRWSEFGLKNFSKFSKEWELKALSPQAACDAIENYITLTFNGRVATPVGHNVGFDVAFLRKLAFLGGRDQLMGLSHRAIDTHTLLYVLAMSGRLPSTVLTSDGAFKHFRIRIPDEVRHTALGDAIATRELLEQLLELIGADTPITSHQT